MDLFEPIRQAAHHLHQRAVTRGADPLQHGTLIEAALLELDIELEWVRPDNTGLKGALAVYDEQFGVICCADVGSTGERAFRVAHELGHAQMHVTSSCHEHDIAPSRPVEAARAGLQRVEDYGMRERRELQANVFGREFLFPRDLARRMHVAQGLGARQIADELNLPLDLVRQQLLDALLLPPPSTEPEKPRRASPPADPSQTRAAAHQGSAFLLQAGPGTGKTSTLITRVQSLLAEGVDASAILVLTFSNRAARELVERIASVAGKKAGLIWIGTFHAFGLDLLRRYHHRLELPPNPVLFDRSDVIEVLEEVLPTLRLRHYQSLKIKTHELKEILTAISRAKDELVDTVQYRKLCDQMLASAPSEGERREAAKCLDIAYAYERYQEILREHGAVDFGDLVMRPTLLLEANEDVRQVVQLRHRHVLVDEYQDVNRASGRLLRALAGDGRRLWVVGDTRQSIYRFRGASSSNMSLFRGEYPGSVTDRLEVNYRSTQEIVETYTAFAGSMRTPSDVLPLQLRAQRGAGLQPQLRVYGSPDDEAAGVAAAVRELQADGVGLKDQAVLCRSNARLNEIASALESHGIPVLHLGNLFEREEIRDLLAVLSLVVDPHGDGLVRVGRMPRYELSLQDVHRTCAHLRQSGQQAPDGLGTAAIAAGLSTPGREGLDRLAADLAGLTSSTSPWEALTTYLLDSTRYLAELSQDTRVQSQMRGVAIWQFLAFLLDKGPTGPGQPIRRTIDRIRQLVLLDEERDLRQVPAAALHMDAVRLMTVHGSKGLEFEAVHIPGLTVSSFPAQERGPRCPIPDGMLDAAEDRDLEEECLFFVALSRARNHLRITRCSKQRDGKNRNGSPFLARIHSWLRQEPVPQQAPSILTGSDNIALTWSRERTLTDRDITLYDKCRRRFFYTRVLRLGGKGRQTGVSKTQDCVYRFIDHHLRGGPAGPIDPYTAQMNFTHIWGERGPTDHAAAEEYRGLGLRLVETVVQSSAGHQLIAQEDIVVRLSTGSVLVRPDAILRAPDGAVVFRRVQLGKKRKEEHDGLEYTLYRLAAEERYGQTARVETLYVTTGEVEPMSITEVKLQNRKDKIEGHLAEIVAGRFDPKPNAMTCPQCPHFLVCDAVPRGPLIL